MSQYPAVDQLPGEGIKTMIGQEMMAGFGNFTAVADGLKTLSVRKQGVLVAKVTKDETLSGR